jgi:hypothetical protein
MLFPDGILSDKGDERMRRNKLDEAEKSNRIIVWTAIISFISILIFFCLGAVGGSVNFLLADPPLYKYCEITHACHVAIGVPKN